MTSLAMPMVLFICAVLLAKYVHYCTGKIAISAVAIFWSKIIARVILRKAPRLFCICNEVVIVPSLSTQVAAAL